MKGTQKSQEQIVGRNMEHNLGVIVKVVVPMEYGLWILKKDNP